MMRLILCLLFAFTALSSQAELLRYNNSYQGIIVGQSTLADTMQLHGEPLKVNKTLDNATYFYSGFNINISDYKSTIVSIAITDPNYVDINDMKVGFPVEILVTKFHALIDRDGYYVDKNNGIIYWLRNGVVTTIALASELNF